MDGLPEQLGANLGTLDGFNSSQSVSGTLKNAEDRRPCGAARRVDEGGRGEADTLVGSETLKSELNALGQLQGRLSDVALAMKQIAELEPSSPKEEGRREAGGPTPEVINSETYANLKTVGPR